MTQPTHHQIDAVRKAIRDPDIKAKLKVAMRNLTRAMNLDPTAELQPNDVRDPAGSGPQWYYPDGAGLDKQVSDGAKSCDQIAALLLQIRDMVAHVTFPPGDKKHLTASIEAEAASWTARGRAWRSPTPPGDAKSATASVAKHIATCVSERTQVNKVYFQ
jgi:hypothetical protein